MKIQVLNYRSVIRRLLASRNGVGDWHTPAKSIHHATGSLQPLAINHRHSTVFISLSLKPGITAPLKRLNIFCYSFTFPVVLGVEGQAVDDLLYLFELLLQEGGRVFRGNVAVGVRQVTFEKRFIFR